jgi:hypothetical protein
MGPGRPFDLFALENSAVRLTSSPAKGANVSPAGGSERPVRRPPDRITSGHLGSKPARLSGAVCCRSAFKPGFAETGHSLRCTEGSPTFAPDLCTNCVCGKVGLAGSCGERAVGASACADHPSRDVAMGHFAPTSGCLR